MHETRRLFTLTILAAACITLTTRDNAHASPPASIAAASDSKPGERRTELNLGMLAGGSDIGESRRRSLGVSVQVGRRFGDVVLLGEYGYLSLGKPDSDNRGSLSRAGITARYSLLRTSYNQRKRHRRSPVSGDYWLELGAGVERIAWDKGGVVHRPDVALGFGWQLNAVIDRKSRKPRYYGPYVGFRAMVAQAPESTMDLPSMCAGPCDRATPPPRSDVSLFLHTGINWGR